MTNESFPLTPDEDLRAAIEIKALNLELNYGMQHASFSDDMPPELLSQWLDNVTRFEAQYANAEQVTIYEFIKKPTIRAVETLQEEELEPEIKRLLDLLAEYSIMTDRPEHLLPGAYYQFLTEEFLQHQIISISVDGMVQFFPYDEFHRDGPVFIQVHAEEFIQDLMDIGHGYKGVWLSENLQDDQQDITKLEALQRIDAFRQAWKGIGLGHFAPITIKATNAGIDFLFHVAWFGIPEAENSEREHHEGLGVIQMGFEDGDWLIKGVNMPGFEF